MFATLGTSSIGADAATVQSAISLLAAVSDPASAKQILDRIAASLDEMKALQAAVVAAESANAERLKGLLATEQAQQARAAELDTRSSDLAAHQTRIDVAASALSEREAKLSQREAAVSEAEAKVARDAEALVAKTEAYRRALG